MDSCGTVRGEDGVDGRAEIANGFLAPKYFHELRDKQQLGYVVHSGISASARLMMFDSSSDYAPDVLAQRTDAWVTDACRVAGYAPDRIRGTTSSATPARGRPHARRTLWDSVV